MMAENGYVRLPQQEDGPATDSEDEAGESPSAHHMRSYSTGSTTATSSTSRPRHQRTTSRSSIGKIDLSSLDNAFKRWTQEITQKVRRKRKIQASEVPKEIVFSVFQRVPPTEGLNLNSTKKTLDDEPPKSQQDFDNLANSVKLAILDGTHPKLIVKGSSGSYFARAKKEGKTQVVGYISEAAASLLDDRLGLNIVPQTQLVSLSSPAFSYGWVDRVNYKKGKQLPEKVGSMQTFMNGYKDASAFLRDHPWPGRAISDTYDDKPHRSGTTSLKKCSNALGVMCGRIGEDVDDDDYDDMYDQQQRPEYPSGSFSWTPAMQQEFREELERLIILDYLMRNTDRGLDNFMIKFCEGQRDSVVTRAPVASPVPQYPTMNHPAPSPYPSMAPNSSTLQPPQMNTPRGPSPNGKAPEREPCYLDRPHMHIAAIDNSLSFPHQHPKGWREFTYGWLYLVRQMPVSLIGRPFSQSTRDVFLPLLSDPEWWSETTFQLRQLHKVDDGFNERMFQRQMAVMKGQGWNIVQVHSPPPRRSLEKRSRSYSIGSRIPMFGKSTAKNELPPFAFPNRSRRPSAADPTMRPVPLSSKNLGHGAMMGAATGVSVLEHLEKLDVVESSLNRVIGDGMSPQQPNSTILFEDAQEDDVGESSNAVPGPGHTTGAEETIREEEDAAKSDDPDTSGDIGVTAVNSAKKKPALAVDLASPQKLKRTVTTLSAIGSNGGPTLEQLLGSDDLESGLSNSQQSDHIRWAANVGGDSTSVPKVRSATERSFDGMSIASGSSSVRDPLRRTRVVVAESSRLSGAFVARSETPEPEALLIKSHYNAMVDLQAESVPQLPAEFTKAIEGIKAKLQAENAAPELSSPKIGIVCGSGLSGLGDILKSKVLVPYEEVEGFGTSTVPGHKSALAFGFLSGGEGEKDVPVVAMLGRGFNALLGPVLAPPFDTRFVPVSSAYSFELRKAVFKAAHDLQFPSHFLAEGTYAWVSGPTYESPAEGRLLRAAGADVVGMSTVPEVVAAKQAGMEVVVLSLVTNPVVIPETYRSARAEVEAEIAGKPVEAVKEEEVSHEEVLTISKLRGDDMKRLVARVVQLV
ncbi:phosphatidyl inositol kinase [Tulasnella sp. 427]|nr:phosphatidyl inositol kinase [Tulasnella sp. 427]